MLYHDRSGDSSCKAHNSAIAPCVSLLTSLILSDFLLYKWGAVVRLTRDNSYERSLWNVKCCTNECIFSAL